MLKNINYQGFRNLTDGNLSCVDGLNFIIGDNAAGKTNLLEAIFYVGCASSFRVREEKNLIKTNREYLRINAQANGTEASIYLDKDQKRLTLGGNEIHRLGEYLGWLSMTILSIDDIWLIRGAPARRRSYLDWLIAQLKPGYLATMSEYRRLIQQRNRLLFDMKNNGIGDLLDSFDEKFIDIANAIYSARAAYLPGIQEKIGLLSGQFNLHKLAIEYQSTIPEMTLNRRTLENNRRREIAFGHSLIGPHRDDILIKINNQPCRHYASEGEERTIAITLRLSEAEMLYEQNARRPVLLLDEVGAELDDSKRKQIFSMLFGQVFYASTRMPASHSRDRAYQIINVKRGTIEIPEKN